MKQEDPIWQVDLYADPAPTRACPNRVLRDAALLSMGYRTWPADTGRVLVPDNGDAPLDTSEALDELVANYRGMYFVAKGEDPESTRPCWGVGAREGGPTCGDYLARAKAEPLPEGATNTFAPEGYEAWVTRPYQG